MSFAEQIANEASTWVADNPNSTRESAYLHAFLEGMVRGYADQVAYQNAQIAYLEGLCPSQFDPFTDSRVTAWYDPTHDSHLGIDSDGDVVCVPDLVRYNHLHILPVYGFPSKGQFTGGTQGLRCNQSGIVCSGNAKDGPETHQPPYTVLFTFELAAGTVGKIAGFSAAGGGKFISVDASGIGVHTGGAYHNSVVSIPHNNKVVVFIEITSTKADIEWHVGSNPPLLETVGHTISVSRIGMSLGAHNSGGAGFNGVIGPCGAFDGILTAAERFDIAQDIRFGNTPESPTPPPQDWITKKTVLVGTSVAADGGHVRMPFPVINNAIGQSTVDLLGTDSGPTVKPLCARPEAYDQGFVVDDGQNWPITGTSADSFINLIIDESPDVVLWHYGENSQPYTAARIGDTTSGNRRSKIGESWRYVLDEIFAHNPDIQVYLITKWRANDAAVDQMMRDIALHYPNVFVVELNANTGLVEPIQVPGPYTIDGTHPEEEGKQVIASTLRSLLIQ